jgi:hypothetical protein
MTTLNLALPVALTAVETTSVTFELVIPKELLDEKQNLDLMMTELIAHEALVADRRKQIETATVRINKVLAYLRGEEVPADKPAAPGRKPMSQAGKDAIRAGLLAAAARKREAAEAAKAVPQAAPVVETASVPTPAPVPPAKASGAKKAGK